MCQYSWVWLVVVIVVVLGFLLLLDCKSRNIHRLQTSSEDPHSHRAQERHPMLGPHVPFAPFPLRRLISASDF